MRKKWAISIFSGALLMSSLSSATTLIQQSFDDMVQSASACVVAEKVSVEYLDVQGSMVTLTTFQVNDTAFGEVGETIVVRTAGGVKKRGKISTAEVVAGSPRFFDNSQSLLLLNENNGTNDYSIVGFSQGVFNVVETAQGALVNMPENLGGSLSVDEAVDMMSARRSAGATIGLPL
ncbi:hypothetical protein EYS14_05445 [Alteromonadaceae bacterium M269]|nr:hypothetical protein EYS14_05445 [Alteromonadaceae bacterium M269]